MNRRRRSCEASRAANASSSRSSIRFSAVPRRPTSVRGSVVATRWERSPPAIAAAVCPIRSSGSSPTRTTTVANTPMSTSTPPITRRKHEQQPVQRLLGGAHRDRGDGDRRRRRSSSRARGRRPADVSTVSSSPTGMSLGQLGCVAVSSGPRNSLVEDAAVGVAQLAVGVGRGAPPPGGGPPPRPPPRLNGWSGSVSWCWRAGTALASCVVETVELERALRGVGDPADEQHARGGQHQHAGDEPATQRSDHARGARSV